MARYYRRRYTRVVRPKKKWASNFRDILMRFPQNTAIPEFAQVKLLCVNGEETQGVGPQALVISPTPVIVKTGNYKVQCDVAMGTSAAALVSVYVYVVYIPEGVLVENTLQASYNFYNQLVLKHPEWVLAWKQVGSELISANTNIDRVTFSSRLKRNLNSGDGVYLVVTGHSSDGNITRCDISGKVQFWTCAN